MEPTTQLRRAARAMVIAGITLVQLASCSLQPEDASQQPCRVTTVHDGDTVTLQCGRESTRVRLYCIDAPEMEQRPWGSASRNYLREISQRQVTRRSVTRDRYGRDVAELYDISGESINLRMVRSGHAVVYTQFCSEERYHQANQLAKAERRGVWARSGQQQRPWIWRQQQTKP
jgi:endonuclease YncB( thermonuclease family)